MKDYTVWPWPHGVIEDGCKPKSSLVLELILHAAVQLPMDGRTGTLGGFRVQHWCFLPWRIGNGFHLREL